MKIFECTDEIDFDSLLFERKFESSILSKSQMIIDTPVIVLRIRCLSQTMRRRRSRVKKVNEKMIDYLEEKKLSFIISTTFILNL